MENRTLLNTIEEKLIEYDNKISPGNSVAVVNVSSAITPEQLARGLSNLSRLGLKSTVLQGRTGPVYVGSKEERTKLLKEASSFSMILCASGGFGSFELLDDLPHTSAMLVGMSGNAILLHAMAKKADCYVHSNLDGLHGKTLENFERFFFKGDPQVLSSLSPAATSPIEGRIIAGQLRVIESLIGTPFEPDWTDGILCIEEKERGAGDLLRAIQHFKHAGILGKLKAIILGHIDPSPDPTKISYLKSQLSVPFFQTEEFGHSVPNAVLPLGKRARIENTTLTVVETTPP